ncbi:MAG: 16S rRNA (uracil(1498)-N(3))-methyltransferase [Crocinitomicaceae bacterium]|nr:16S rRNA (uracil(1498)-N(3))-methyltransferase [Crocinitomicaceae bacterium]MDG1657096.1 16S rRNA (uracil(1498)-N(3))-methyltransferase [Crocinitomicaceae bacterium]|tara:strand:- start:286 stop:984 length:699 start_codon:yes stop_codon:yes gene_type:complete
MRIFFDSNIAAGATTHQLSETESKHIVKVLRMTYDDSLGLINGMGGYFEAKISNAHPKRCELLIISEEIQNSPAEEIHVALGPTKQMERIEWFVEKATEIGITEISFITGANSERVRMKPERLKKKAISAMKQSQRRFLPRINELTSVSEFIKTHPNGLIAHCYDGEKSSLTSIFKSSGCPILIGPEGDFTKDEIDLALENGYKTITLGENRLRTETAALCACMQARLTLDQ